MTSSSRSVDATGSLAGAGSADPAEESVVEELPILDSPADGVPDLVDDEASLEATIKRFAAGTGPVAVDAERAHGFRYSARAYLIQLRREGAGTALIDPVAFRPGTGEADLSALGTAIVNAEWIVHAASQDLPCLVEINLVPERLFDTELAARLLGDPRVGLSTLIENAFGQRLLKEHSAANWSTRPLPEQWLNYAALDVELLIELREILATRLDEAGKREWAEQEFAYLAAHSRDARPPRAEPWRRTSGIHAVRNPRGLASVRELWLERDALARKSDTAPGRIVPDRAISDAGVLSAKAAIARPQLRSIAGFNRRTAKRFEANWLAALQRAGDLDQAELPSVRAGTDELPPTKTWANKKPAAHARFSAAREAMIRLAEQAQLPVENMLTPDFLRQLAWAPPTPVDINTVDERLAGLGARPWQRELVTPEIVQAFTPTPD